MIKLKIKNKANGSFLKAEGKSHSWDSVGTVFAAGEIEEKLEYFNYNVMLKVVNA